MTDASPKPSSRFSIAAGAGWLLMICFALGGAFVGDIYDGPPFEVRGIEIHRVTVWLALYGVGFIGYACLLWTFHRKPISVRSLLVAAILLRASLLFCQPNNDCNRYIWEGRIQGLGFNPYADAPDADALKHLRDDVWEGINKKHYTTIYPPLSELEFRLLSLMHYSVKTPQVAHTLLDLGVVCALLYLLRRWKRPAWHAAVYALNPLVLASFAFAGHNDTLMILGLLGFLAAGQAARWRWAGAALGLAILAKTTPAILLVVLLRRSKTAIAMALLVVALGYLLYIDAGSRLFFALVDFPDKSSFNNLFDSLRLWLGREFDWVTRSRARNFIALGVLACLTAYKVVRPRDLVGDTHWLLAAVLLLLPIIHFWYLSWIVVLVALRPRANWSWILLTGTMGFYWLADWRWQSGERWALPLWAVAAIWAPFFAAWMVEKIAGRKSASVGIGGVGE